MTLTQLRRSKLTLLSLTDSLSLLRNYYIETDNNFTLQNVSMNDIAKAGQRQKNSDSRDVFNLFSDMYQRIYQ